MESMYLLLLLAFSAANCEFSDYEREKLGCLLSPEICTPPEDCDGLTGSCQLPYDETEWRYQENQPSLSDLVREMRSRGHDVNLEDVVRTLLHSRPLYEKYHQQTYNNEQYGGTDDNIQQVLSYLESRNQYNVPRELRRSVGTPRQRDPAPDENVGMDTDSTATMDEKRMQRMRELVDEAKVSLAKKGKRLSDLNPHEVKLLARHLSKIFKEEEQRKTANVEAPETSVDELKTSVLRTSVSSNEPELEHTQELLQIPQAIEDSIVPKEGAEKSVSNEGDTDFEVQKKSNDPEPPTEKVKPKRDTLYVVIIVVGATVLLIILVTIISCIMHAYRTRKKEQKKFIGSVTSDEIQPFGSDYQELCRQLYASKNSETTQNQREIIDSSAGVQDPLITHTYPLTKPVGNGTSGKQTDADSLSAQSNLGRNSSVSSVSWSEEPVTSNLDITTGHAVLSYMEDHLNNKNRLDKEWEEICGYEADSITTAAAITPQNSRKNRSVVALPYDHNRIKLNPDNNQFHSDYINASAIIDNDPKRPLYIAAQGPLPSTIPDFWQMMWEQGCVAIVMLTPLVEEGVNQCTRYWPDEGSCTYHNFEIHLVSEHIWCEDYLVRSLYLKHLGTGSTRTVTQFHFLSWPKDRVPSTPKPLLELRRKVTKCYKGHNSPVLVHCSDGVGRTGTYILLDLAIDRMLKGAKEIDIAATLEHIRDQRVGMVGNRGQFEFALTAVAEEVNAILKTLLH